MIESIRTKDQTTEETAPRTTKKGSKQAEKPVAAPMVEPVAPAAATEPQETPQIDAPAEPVAPKVYTAGEYWFDERKRQEQADNELRNDPELRMEMCRVIDELDKMLDDHAAALAHQDGDSGAYNMDVKKDLLTWMLGEFLTRSIIEHSNPDEPQMTRGWQVDQTHAFDFFRVSKYGDSSLVALEVEESRK